jgi:hypothetical protein
VVSYIVDAYFNSYAICSKAIGLRFRKSNNTYFNLFSNDSKKTVRIARAILRSRDFLNAGTE